MTSRASPQCNSCFFNTGAHCGKNNHGYPAAYHCTDYAEGKIKEPGTNIIPLKPVEAIVVPPLNRSRKNTKVDRARELPDKSRYILSHFED